MTVRGQEDVNLPYQVLTSRDGIYFSSIALSMWDNIHGPRILMTWKGSDVKIPEDPLLGKSSGITDSTLLTIANFTLNDEAGRVEKLDGIETKFYCLKKYDVIASVSIFAIEVFRGKFEVFSFILILPYLEMPEFLPRHSICESKLQRLLKEHFILPLKEMAMDHSSIQNKVSQVLMGFHGQLFRFTQVMLSTRKWGLPNNISVSDTFLPSVSDAAISNDMKAFLPQVMTSHLQSSGYTVVLGSDGTQVNKMIKTLGLFLSPNERKMSRLVSSQVDEGALYEPDLFIQGIILADSSSSGILPFTKEDLYYNKLPPTIVHLDAMEVYVFEQKIPRFIRRKEDECRQVQRRSEFLNLKELSLFNKDWCSTAIQDFLFQISILPSVSGVKETFVWQFLKLLKLRALTLAKYVDAEPKSSIQDLAAEVLALGRGNNIADRPKINQVSLQQDLTIDSVGDLYVILAFAEKIRPKTYLDVLGDPQLNDLAMIKEFQNF